MPLAIYGLSGLPVNAPATNAVDCRGYAEEKERYMNHAFIHVADTHYCRDAPEGASSIMKAFLGDVDRQIKALRRHQFYIALAGDVVRAGMTSVRTKPLFARWMVN
jgi:hypothetical protein